MKNKTNRLMKVLTGFLFLLLLSGCASQRIARHAKPFFFIQISDTQLGFYPKKLPQEIALYEKAVEEVNRLKPDFVVITGDLINDAKDKNQMVEFKRITAMISKSIPVYLIPGNHDVSNTPKQEDIDFYKAQHGYETFSFDHKQTRFIGFNSNLIKANTPGLEQAQYDWLEKELAKAKHAKHIVLFSHHPFFISSPDEPEQYFNISIKTRTQYLELFKKYKVDVVFAGHLHKNAFGKYGDMEMVTTSAIGEPLGKDPSGFRIITVGTEKITHQYYNIDSIPARIELK
jgi:3',5'-cyclic AMP phosphodiesterase CpdA